MRAQKDTANEVVRPRNLKKNGTILKVKDKFAWTENYFIALLTLMRPEVGPSFNKLLLVGGILVYIFVV